MPTRRQSFAPSARPVKKLLKFSLILGGFPFNDFWDTVRAGAENASAELAIDYPQFNANTELGISADDINTSLNAAIDDNVDGIVVALLYPDENKDAIESVISAGIPLVTINSGYQYSQGLGALTHVGSNATKAGQTVGKYFNSMGKENLLCLVSDENNVGLVDRCENAAEVFQGTYTRASFATTDDVLSLLDADPSIDAIYVSGLLGADNDPVAAVEQFTSGDSNTVSIVGHDLSSLTIEYLQSGKIDWIVDQQPYLQGYLPIILLNLKVKVDQAILTPFIQTGPVFLNASNADSKIPFKGITWN